jgi:multicomponent Na+:H+ antiporter subunit D
VPDDARANKWAVLARCRPLQTGAPLVYLLGGWTPPLGLALRADGLSAVMMAIRALIIRAIGVFARGISGTFAAVPLVCPDGRAETLQAALRHLLFAIFGSALYLAGTALLYGAYGTLDIVLLSDRVQAGPVTLIAPPS